MATAVGNTAPRSSSPVEIFYSYSHKDEELRNELDKHLSILRRQGFISGWHDRRIIAGSEWAGEIDQHLNSARIILLLISSDFLASNYCNDLEMTRAMERHESGEAVVVPIILRDVDWGGAPFGKLQALPTDAKAVTSFSNLDQAFTNIAKGIRKVVEELSTGPKLVGPSTKSSILPNICNLPHLRNPNFTGRDELLKQLRESLTSGKAAALTQALHGLGGVGKTQTAIEYIYRHAADYDIAWWILSEELAKLAAEYAALAEALWLRERSAQDQRIVVQAVRKALSERGRWLLVFDNANKPEEIRDFLPLGAAGHVLVTSRNPAFGGLAHTLKVKTMSVDEAADFLLLRSQQTDRAAAIALAQELDCLPLALEHAGAYIEKTDATLLSYLKTFKERHKELLARAERPDGYDATVATTWELSFVKMEKESPAAAELMNLCAFLAPDDIGREMLKEGAEDLPELLAKAVTDDLAWDDTVAALRRYSLMEVNKGALSVHRLVQAVAQGRMDEEDQKKNAEAAVLVVNAAFPYKQDDVQTWAPCARLLPHALTTAGYTERLRVELKICGRLLNHVGLYLKGRAEFREARSVLERAVKIDEATYGPDHPEVAIDENNLGLVFKELGDLAGARGCSERAVKIGEASYGPDDPKVAIYANNLGGVLQDLGDLAGARASYERALKIDEAAYGPDHATVAIRVNNLGGVLRDLGDLAGAQTCFERALKIGEATYGPEHPNVATIVNNLGNVLQDLGDLPGARACYERALKIDEVAYGPDHPDVARDVNNLGLVLNELGDLAGARTCYERALKICQRMLGEEHANTQMVKRNLERLG